MTSYRHILEWSAKYAGRESQTQSRAMNAHLLKGGALFYFGQEMMVITN